MYGKSETFAAIHESLLCLALSTGSHPSVCFSKDVRMPCDLFDSSRSGERSFGAHMSSQNLHLYAQNTHDTGQSLHDLTGQQEASQVWPLEEIAHGDACPV